MKEVLERLHLPLSLDRYALTRPLPKVLAIAELSSRCRAFLTPKPVSAKRQKELACFLPQPWFKTFKEYDRDRIDNALLLLATAFKQANVPLYLDSGTALGSWRMHGQIPYDPDVDFMVLRRHKAKGKAILERLMAIHPLLFSHYKNGYNFWRMDVIRADKSRLFQIDLFVNTLKEEENILEQVQSPKRMNVSGLMPFVKRPFQGIVLPTWRNMEKYIDRMYGKGNLDVCKPSGWLTKYYKIRCTVERGRCSVES